ncbi:hypothetical protein [Phenylobacterium sp.]|uniref:hypothetical protein n=1 Tax=Phenylobacterium sp. TaxID=1871053 RepID=UPI003567A172
MFEGWDSFYLLIGGAAGALIGLLFVVATLTGNVGREQAMRGAQIYMTPTVFHFAVVLVTSALTAVPHLPQEAAAVAVAVLATLGLAYGLNVCWMLRTKRVTPEAPHWTDFWCYGVWPTTAYLAMLAAAWTLQMRETWAPDALGAVVIALLLLGIRNAWDLVTWLAPTAKEAEARRAPPT